MRLNQLLLETDRRTIRTEMGRFASEDCTYFNCHGKNLDSLEGGPVKATGRFVCNGNQLTSLEHAPIECGAFYCNDNPLTSLEHCPQLLTGTFGCCATKITSLRFGPKVVGDTYYACDNLLLTSLEGAPKIINKYGDFHNCGLTSLKGIHHHIHETSLRCDLDFYRNAITSHVLGLLKIKNLRSVMLANYKVMIIINEHLQGNVNGCNLEACADELCDKGFEDYAQL